MDFSDLTRPDIQWDKDARDGTQLVQRVTEYLRKMIMEAKLTPETQLPNEPDLAAYLDVSRSTVRSALAILEQGGFIQRRWGVGTFVSKNPPTYDNLSLNSGVTQMIRSSGAEPGSAELLIATRPANERVSSQLSLEPGTPILVIERVRLANERRVVFTVDFLPARLFHLPEGDIPLEDLEKHIQEHQSVYGFLRQRLSLDIHHGIAWIRPLLAEQYIADKLQIPAGNSIMHLEQVDFNSDDEGVALSDEYYAADAFRFYIYRSNQGEKL
jgi:GntR family transcriptional regulator